MADQSIMSDFMENRALLTHLSQFYFKENSRQLCRNFTAIFATLTI